MDLTTVILFLTFYGLSVLHIWVFSLCTIPVYIDLILFSFNLTYNLIIILLLYCCCFLFQSHRKRVSNDI